MVEVIGVGRFSPHEPCCLAIVTLSGGMYYIRWISGGPVLRTMSCSVDYVLVESCGVMWDTL